jgi:hypothetical protein
MKKNNGRILWGIEWQSAGAHFSHSSKDLSHLHQMAVLGHTKYVLQMVSRDQKLLRDADGLHLLLSAVINHNPRRDLVQGLLSYGASPLDTVAYLSRSKDQIQNDQRVSIWAVFVFFLAQQFFEKKPRATQLSYFLILEDFLRQLVSTDVYFLLRSKEQDDDAQTESTLVCMTLEELIRLAKPSNMDSLLAQTQVGGRNRASIWAGTVHYVAGFIPSVDAFSQHRSGYKRLSFADRMEAGKFRVERLCLRDSELSGDFKVRVA